MSQGSGIHNPRVVDLATADSTGMVFRLIMVETEPQPGSEQFAKDLVEKVNAYLNFVKSGQCAQVYPDSQRMKVVFQLDHFTPLPVEVLMVVHQLDLKLNQHGLALVTNKLDAD